MTDASVAWVVVGSGQAAGEAVLVDCDADGAELSRATVDRSALAAAVLARERDDRAPRWVWNDTPEWYDALVASGVRVARCHDLRLCHAILRDSALVRDGGELRSHVEWDAAAPVSDAEQSRAALFDWADDAQPAGPPGDVADALAELARQRQAIAASADPGRLRLLCSAESAGALIAVEMRHAGLPWRVLLDTLGARPAAGGQPARIAELAAQVREALGDPHARLDSQPRLLRSLHRVGLAVESTSRWELRRHEHPAIPPLIEYKKLTRLMSANGWTWLSEWVRDGRFRPVYVPAGVVTGRWASSGGGALQIPRGLRTAVRADPGWMLVVADVAQLEPRVLAAMSRDLRLAEAARGQDLYQGIVDTGTIPSRAHAKVAMLGAMYGATTGDSGRLLPALRRTYPRAMALVDEAAQVGVDGGVVSTWLGRTSPPPSERWRATQARASDAEASPGEVDRARRWAGDWGRFTRNFVVQGTAAEWALVWLADLRARLAALPQVDERQGAPASGPLFSRRPHLAFFLHDELIVHTPASQADAVADAVRAAAAAAGRMLFGGFPVDFPLDLRIARSAEKA